MNKRSWFILLLLVGLLMALEIYVIHEAYVSVIVGGNDFYPRWAGAKALLVEGRNPYSSEVTQEIIAVLDPENRGLNSFSFAYPLHAIFVFLPLAYVSYDWAIASWMVIVQWAAIATLAVLLRYHRWLPSPPVLGGLVLATLFFYPVTRSIFLGQFTVHVVLALALTILALKQERDWIAGIIFALTSIKPQMVLLVGGWLVLWAIREKRYRFLGGIAIGGSALLAASMALLPSWPIDFLGGLGQYSDLAGGKEPLDVLLGLFLPGDTSWLKSLLLIALGASTIYVIWKGWQRHLSFDVVLHLAIIINLLAFFQTGTTNHVLLLVPFVAWLADVRKHRRAWMAWFLAAVILVANWVLFLQTIEGNYEHPVLFLPLPLLALAIFVYRLQQSSIAFPVSRPVDTTSPE